MSNSRKNQKNYSEKKKTKYFDLEIEEQEKWIRIYMRGPKL